MLEIIERGPCPTVWASAWRLFRWRFHLRHHPVGHLLHIHALLQQTDTAAFVGQALVIRLRGSAEDQQREDAQAKHQVRDDLGFGDRSRSCEWNSRANGMVV